jgi:ActR/RegA family two-component response regulator
VRQPFVTARTTASSDDPVAADVRYSSVVEEVVPASSSPCVLVVADPGRVAELAQALSEPLPQGAIDVAASSGGDDTIELFEARRPRVVVLDATLEVGDAKSLIEALRDMVPRDELVIVLVGDDEKGPIRNALDAIDMKPDRFVSRPLQAKALRFAVGSGLDNVARALGELVGDAAESTELPPNVQIGDAAPGIDSSQPAGEPDERDRFTQPISSRTTTPVRGSAGGDARRSISPTVELPALHSGHGDMAATSRASDPGSARRSGDTAETSAASDPNAETAASGPRPATSAASDTSATTAASEPIAARSAASDTSATSAASEPIAARSAASGTSATTAASEPIAAMSVSRDANEAWSPTSETSGPSASAHGEAAEPTGGEAEPAPAFQRMVTQPRGSGPISISADQPATGRVITATRGGSSDEAVTATHDSSSDQPATGRVITATRGSSSDEPSTERVITATRGSSSDEPSTGRVITATRGSSSDEPSTERVITATRGSAGEEPPPGRITATRGSAGEEPSSARVTTATRGSGPAAAVEDEVEPTLTRSPTPARGSASMPVLSDTDHSFVRSTTTPRFSQLVEAGDVPPVVSRANTRPAVPAPSSNGDELPAVTRAKTDRGTGISEPVEPAHARPPTERGTGISMVSPAADADPQVTRAALRARWEALADSIGGVDDDDDALDEITEDRAPPLPPIEIQPRRKGGTNPEFTPVPPVAPWRPGTTSEIREESDLSPPAREPTLILHDDVPARATPPPEAVPPAPPMSVTERDARRERWSHPVLLSELIDRSRDSSRELLANVGGADDLADLDDIDDDIIVGHPIHTPPPHVMRGGKLQQLDDLMESEEPYVEPEPAREPPARPSDDKIGGRDFARQLRAKMSMMAQRLFQSDSPASQPSVDVRPRHDHHTEIDLAALGEEPALGGGVTEIGRPTMSEPVALATSPGSWDTQVRERGLPDSGEMMRGVSDAAMILARMFALDFTGRVGFRKDDVEKVVYFDQGRPVFASSNEPGDRMGELLVREGKITAAQYERCQVVVAESGRRMGEILVDFGYLKRRELLPAVRRHVEDILYSLFGWDRGVYHVTTEPTASAERIRLSRHPASLVLEGIRRKLGRSTLEKVLGPPSTVIEVPDRERLGGILNTGDLAAEERTALAAFDGQADLAQVAHATGVDIADVLPLAWGLCVLGLATARRAETELEESTALVGETDLAIDRERVHARWQLVTEADYFALLGVRRDATGFEIRRAYQAARRDFAPEGFPSDLRRELARELEDIASVLDEAFRVLRDDRLRQTYLANLVE